MEARSIFLMLDISVLVILFPLLLVSLILLINDPHGEEKGWVDFAISIGFFIAIVYVVIGTIVMRKSMRLRY